MGAEGPVLRAPKQRPAWLVMIAAIMLISAARLSMAGLFTLTDNEPAAISQTALVVTPEDAAAKTVELASSSVKASHKGLLRAQAAGQVALALFLLYVTAAVFSLDPRGRTLAILAAWVGALYHLAGMVLSLLVLRPAIMQVAPKVVAEMASGASPSALGADLLTALRALSVLLPVLTALFGLGFSALILFFFGGRRGRAFYGYEAGPQQGGAE